MASSTHPSRSTSRAALAIGLVLLVLGLATAVVSFGRTVGGVISAAIDSDTDPEYQAPGSVTVHLQRGSYLLMQATDQLDGYGSLVLRAPVSITADQVRVSGPAGDPEPLFRPQTSHHDVGGIGYTAAVGFDAPHTGDYQVVVGGTAGGHFILNRDLALLFHDSAGRIYTIAVGGVIALLGLVMATLGATPRHRDGAP